MCDDNPSLCTLFQVELYPALRKALLDVCAKLDDATGRDEGGIGGGGNTFEGGSGAGLSSSSLSSSLHSGSLLLGGEGTSSEPLAKVLSRHGISGLQDVASGVPLGSSNGSSGHSGSGGGGLDRPGWAAAAGLGPTSGLFADAGLSPDLLRAVTGLNPITTNNKSQTGSAMGASGGGHNDGITSTNGAGGSSSSGNSGSGNSGSGGGHGGGARAQALLKALSSCEVRFLEKSVAAVMKPVEQMFPSHEGYANAIPSKHDLMAFMRVVQVGLGMCLRVTASVYAWCLCACVYVYMPMLLTP